MRLERHGSTDPYAYALSPSSLSVSLCYSARSLAGDGVVEPGAGEEPVAVGGGAGDALGGGGFFEVQAGEVEEFHELGLVWRLRRRGDRGRRRVPGDRRRCRRGRRLAGKSSSSSTR